MKCNPILVFNHFATGFPKRSSILITSDRLSPHNWSNWKAISAGEDAFFSTFNAIGVADGVGGWQGQENANAALFSKKLMHYCSLELEQVRSNQRNTYNTSNPYKTSVVDHQNTKLNYLKIDSNAIDQLTTGICPQSIIKKAYDRTIIDAMKEKFVGSSTVCVALLTNGDELRFSNIGDCGLAIIREGEYVFRSEEQQHSFNFPFQLGTSQAGDQPEASQQYSFRVAHGDILVLASDGVWDNVFDNEILDLVRQCSGWAPTRWPPGSNPLGISESSHSPSSGRLGSAMSSAIEWMARSVRAAAGLDPGLTSMDSPNPTVPPPENLVLPPIPPPPALLKPHTHLVSTSVVTSKPPLATQSHQYTPRSVPSAMNTAAIELFSSSIDDIVEFDPHHRLLMPIVQRTRRAVVHAAARANPQKIAETIARRAKESAEDPKSTSPFQSRAMREGLYFQGGKIDDIAVVVAIVRDPARLMRSVQHGSRPVGNVSGMT